MKFNCFIMSIWVKLHDSLTYFSLPPFIKNLILPIPFCQVLLGFNIKWIWSDSSGWVFFLVSSLAEDLAPFLTVLGISLGGSSYISVSTTGASTCTSATATISVELFSVSVSSGIKVVESFYTGLSYVSIGVSTCILSLCLPSLSVSTYSTKAFSSGISICRSLTTTSLSSCLFGVMSELFPFYLGFTVFIIDFHSES